MKNQKRFVRTIVLLLSIITVSVTTSLAQQTQRDPLAGLKRVIMQAGAPALTAQQEADLNTLITNFQNAQPSEPDAALEAARDAFDAAILAGDLAAATAQAAIIATRSAELHNLKLTAEATFEIGVLAVLKSGGQYDTLQQKLGNDRLLALVGSLAGHGFDGGFGGGPRGGHGRH